MDRTEQHQLLRGLRRKKGGEFKANLGNFTKTLSQSKRG